jgi:hypothetical protein
LKVDITPLRITGESESFGALRLEAESAIAGAGGYAVLASEADSVLRTWRTETGRGDCLPSGDWACARHKKIQMPGFVESNPIMY